MIILSKTELCDGKQLLVEIRFWEFFIIIVVIIVIITYTCIHGVRDVHINTLTYFIFARNNRIYLDDNQFLFLFDVEIPIATLYNIINVKNIFSYNIIMYFFFFILYVCRQILFLQLNSLNIFNRKNNSR